MQAFTWQCQPSSTKPQKMCTLHPKQAVRCGLKARRKQVLKDNGSVSLHLLGQLGADQLHQRQLQPDASLEKAPEILSAGVATRHN